MITNPNAYAIPHLFEPQEVKDLHAIMTNPLVRAYIQSMRLTIMQEREQDSPTTGTLQDRVAEIVVVDATLSAKLELLDTLEQVPNMLAQQINKLPKQTTQPQS